MPSTCTHPCPQEPQTCYHKSNPLLHLIIPAYELLSILAYLNPQAACCLDRLRRCNRQMECVYRSNLPSTYIITGFFAHTDRSKEVLLANAGESAKGCDSAKLQMGLISSSLLTIPLKCFKPCSVKSRPGDRLDAIRGIKLSMMACIGSGHFMTRMIYSCC